MNFIDDFSSFGFNISTELVDQSKTKGPSWQSQTDPGFEDVSLYGFTNNRKRNAINKGKLRNYATLKPLLRYYAKQSMIEEVVETICDEVINFDKSNRFCKIKEIETGFKDEIIETVNAEFNRIYSLLGFNSRIYAWNLFKKWIEEGRIAFEIIYNKAQTEIIGFKEINNVENLRYLGVKRAKKGEEKNTTEWWEFRDNFGAIRQISDNRLILISYSGIDKDERTSYIERLIKPFNILESLEMSKVIFNFTNSTYNKIITVPTTGKGKTQERQTVSDVVNTYTDEIEFDEQLGKISVNGENSRPWFKEYFFSERNGERPRVETLQNGGPDINNLELDYHIKKFYEASKVPQTRFEENGGSFSLGDPTSQERKEIRFSMFLNRLKAVWGEILIKPLYRQMLLSYPELEMDDNFYNYLQLEFIKNNYFEELKEFEIRSRRINHINEIKGITRDDDDRTSFFSTKLLLKKYLDFSEEFLDENKKEMDEMMKNNDDGF